MAGETKNLFIFAPAQPLHPDEGTGIAIHDVLSLALESAATGAESRKSGAEQDQNTRSARYHSWTPLTGWWTCCVTLNFSPQLRLLFCERHTFTRSIWGHWELWLSSWLEMSFISYCHLSLGFSHNKRAWWASLHNLSHKYVAQYGGHIISQHLNDLFYISTRMIVN